MTKVEIMKEALTEIGEASSQEISAFVEKKYGVKIEPAYVPVLRAILKDKEMMANSRKRPNPAGDEPTTGAEKPE